MTGLDQLLKLFDALEWLLYAPTDRPEVGRFRCAHYGDKAAEAAQKVIRGAPDHMADFGRDPMVVLARDEGDLVGVVIFGPEDEEVVTVFSLGVKLSRQRQGIGTLLKICAMGITANRSDWPKSVASEVHRTNYKMIALNDKLGVSKVPDPTNGEFLLSAITVKPNEKPAT
jgi:hypothetical protein